jgi:hypothetical protein
MSTLALFSIDTSSPLSSGTTRSRSVWQSLLAARARQGERIVAQRLLSMTDERLAELRLSPEQIATLRATGRLTWPAGDSR